MKIVITGKPIAKKRPRFARRGKFVQTYSDQETEEGKALWEIRNQWKLPPIEGAINVHFMFSLQRPKSHMGTGRNAGTIRKTAPAYPGKPDIDNYVKFYMDCMNDVCWKDDAQVVSLRAVKVYSLTDAYTQIDINRRDV